MALTHATVIYDVTDAHVYPLLTDAVGASPTYGAAVDLPGIAAFSADPNFVTAELKGDATIVAKKGRTDRMNVACTYDKLSTDALKVIMGGVTGDTASTQTAYRLSAPASLPYFKLEAQILDAEEGVGSVIVVLWKCQLTGGTLLSTSSDNFSQPTLQADAIAIQGSIPAATNSIVGASLGAIMDVVLNSTAVALDA